MDRSRSPRRLWDEHWAAIEAGDLERAVSNYAVDARVIMPGRGFVGREEIIQGLTDFHRLFDGTPTPRTLDFAREVILFTWSFTGAGLIVEHGVDTYVVRDGLIHDQTVYAPIVTTRG